MHKHEVIVPRGELKEVMRGRGMPGFSNECLLLSMLVTPYLK